MNYKKFNSSCFDSLITDAVLSDRGRQNLNVHARYDDPCQRFLNAIGMESYIRPHRHALDPKAETLIAVKGVFALFIFDNVGNVQEIIRFGTELYSVDFELSVGIDLSPGIWHTIVALRPGSILMEIKAGPFSPNAAKEPALWAPAEQSTDGAHYLKYLQSLIPR